MPTQIHAKTDALEPGFPSGPEARIHRERHRLASPRVVPLRKGGEDAAANIQVLRQSSADPAASLGAFRGVLFGMLLSVPIWAALAGFAWLALG